MSASSICPAGKLKRQTDDAPGFWGTLTCRQNTEDRVLFQKKKKILKGRKGVKKFLKIVLAFLFKSQVDFYIWHEIRLSFSSKLKKMFD